MTIEPLVRKARQEVRHRWKSYTISVSILIALLILLTVFVTMPKPTRAVHALGGNWPTFLGDNGHSSFNGAETAINSTTAKTLTKKWTLRSGVAGGRITTQPIVANGMLYWGSWDGVEHASNASTGANIWTAPLGQSIDCRSEHLGVLSTAT